MVLNSLIYFCFDVGESKYITVNYGAHLVKNIKDNVLCLNKQQLKEAVAFLLFNCYFMLDLRSSARLLVFLWGLIQLLFLPTYSYTFMKVTG